MSGAIEIPLRDTDEVCKQKEKKDIFFWKYNTHHQINQSIVYLLLFLI